VPHDIAYARRRLCGQQLADVEHGDGLGDRVRPNRSWILPSALATWPPLVVIVVLDVTNSGAPVKI
jgi:hypothetical protein